MAGEGGKRPYWPVHLGVNLSNGNLHLELGPGSCVTCGGQSAGSAYVNPQSSTMSGTVLIYNTLGTANTDLGSKWMLPYSTYLTVAGNGDVTLIDADGTERFFTKDATDTPQPYTSDKEDCTLIKDGTEYILTRRNGDEWVYDTTNLNLKRIDARTGHSITITRDGNQRITSVTDAWGRVTSYIYQTFSSMTRLVEIREPAPTEKGWYSTFLGYDSSGRLIQIMNAIGEATRFEYDGSSRISKAIDGHGHETTYTYDGSSRVTNIEDPDENDTTFAYATSPAITTTVTNRLTFVTVFTFDASGRCIKVKDAEDNEFEFTYDSTTWNVTERLGPKIPVTGTPWSRHREVFIYDTDPGTEHDLLKKELRKATNTDATGTLISDIEWTYNDQHDVLTETDENGNVTTYTYKTVSSVSIGLVETEVNGETQTVTTNTYEQVSSKWRLQKTANGVSKETEFDYDVNGSSYGIPDRITDPAGAITNLKIHVRSRTVSNTGPSGNATTFEYDALDRLVRTVNPDGTATERMYDCCHLVAELNENKVGSKWEYDVMGRPTAETDANGETTKFVYNAEGWMTSRLDPRGKTTTWSYDDIGRPLQIDYPGGYQEIFTYFEPGMVKTHRTKKSSSEDTINFVYNDSYFLIEKDFTAGTDTEFEVDLKGRRTKMTDASGEKRYTWDDADRLIKVVQGPAGFTEGTNENYKIEYAWNAASQKTQTKLTIRTQSAKQWDYAYTDAGYLDTVTNPDSEVTKFEYLTDGRVKKITLRSTAGSNKATREFFYQDTNSSHVYVANKNKHLRKTLDKKQAGTVICSSEYDLDAAGNRLGRMDHDGKYDAWSYDPNQQLRAESRWSAKTPGSLVFRTEYGYDGNGNRTVMFEDGVKTAYTIGNNNEMTEAGADDITYDFYGNAVFINSGGNSYDLSYDYERHLIEIYQNESQIAEFEYDGDGRRMRAEYNQSGVWTNFVHCELTNEILAEYTLVSTTFTIKCLNTYGIGLISSNRESTKRYFHFDGLGNTVALTDASENITDTYVYTAFGNLDSSTGSSVNPYRYVGQWGYYDDGARGCPFAILLLGVRYYIPAYARFLTWDPVRQTNLYWYVRNSPQKWTDSTGRALDWPCIRKCFGQAGTQFGIAIGACLSTTGWACKICLKFGLAGCIANPPMCLGIIQGCASICGREVLGCAIGAAAATLASLASCLAGCAAEGAPPPTPAPVPVPQPPPPNHQDEPGMQILPYPLKEKLHGPAA